MVALFEISGKLQDFTQLTLNIIQAVDTSPASV